MSKYFEELDYCPTPIGTISLRRRFDFKLETEVYEIKLGDEFLMSSLFTASEIALADQALQSLKTKTPNVLVGGLGLGYTAATVLKHSHVGSLLVIDLLQPVIDWHHDEILPLGKTLNNDKRCQLQQGDFFALAQGVSSFDQSGSLEKFDCILLDIDHSPEALLDQSSASFYHPEGLENLKRHMNRNAIFALWSNDAPNSQFTQRLEKVFGFADARPIIFDNPLQNRIATQCVYLASDTSLNR